MRVYYVAGIPYSDELYHHGVKGQKWGVRRTPQELGYAIGNRVQSVANGIQNAINKVAHPFQKAYEKKEKAKQRMATPEFKAKMKKSVKIGAAISAAALLTYGALKVSKLVNEGNRGFLADQRFRDYNNINRAYDDLATEAIKSRRKGIDLRDRLSGINAARSRALSDLSRDVSSNARKTKVLDRIANAGKYYREKGHLML